MELLCIQTHSRGVVVAGNTYPLIQETKNPCCGYKVVDVGIRSDTSWCLCSLCGKPYESGPIWWIGRRLFAQIATEDEVKEAEQAKELIEQ